MVFPPASKTDPKDLLPPLSVSWPHSLPFLFPLSFTWHDPALPHVRPLRPHLRPLCPHRPVIISQISTPVLRLCSKALTLVSPTLLALSSSSSSPLALVVLSAPVMDDVGQCAGTDSDSPCHQLLGLSLLLPFSTLWASLLRSLIQICSRRERRFVI